MKKAEEMRELALSSWIKLECSSRLQRVLSLRAKFRIPAAPYHVGENVLAWRKTNHSSGRWHGPAQIVSLTSIGAFMAVRGVLWKRFLDCLGEPLPPDEPGEPEDQTEHRTEPQLDSAIVEFEPVANVLDRGPQEMQSESSEPGNPNRRRTLSSEDHEDAPVQQRPRMNKGRDGSGMMAVVAVHDGDARPYIPIKREVRLQEVPRRLHRLFLQGSPSKEAKAVRAPFAPLSEEEEQRVMGEEHKRILDSRWIDAWKSQDDPQVYAPSVVLCLRVICLQTSKSRWVIRGYSDPDVAHMTVDSLAPDISEVQMTLQRVYGASAGSPKLRLGSRGSVKVLRLECEVYGTLAGPAAWRRTVVTVLAAAKREGRKGHPLSGCLLCYFEGQHAVGWILVLVDDLLVGGHGKAWEHMLQSLKSSFEFVKCTSLTQTEPQSYGGRSMRQLPDWPVMSDMSDYVAKIGMIEIENKG
eukprot:5448067-Amphidinium_carterae.6